jgi:hypothetical protein
MVSIQPKLKFSKLYAWEVEFVFLQGQCRGTTMCTTCGRVKRNFDPFTNLVVRFPETLKTRVTVFSSDGTERPAQHTITVNQETTYQDIVNTLSSLCSIRADEKLLLAEVKTATSL